MNMRIKNFQAETISEALGLVKKELGPDAIILKTTPLERRGNRGVAGGRVFQVTACVDAGTLPAAGGNGSEPRHINTSVSDRSLSEIRSLIVELQKDIHLLASSGKSRSVDGRLNDELASHYVRLVDQDIDPSLAENILANVAKCEIDLDDEMIVKNAIASEIIERLTETSEIKMFAGKASCIALVGPPGSGKSSLAAKLASHLVFKKKSKVTLSTMDDFKPSAPDEMKRVADILKVPCVTGAPSRRGRASHGVILIDTPGIPVGATSEREEVRNSLDDLDVDEIYVVLPAYCRWQDMRRWYEFFKPMGATSTALTFLDQTHIYGNAISLSILENAKLSYFSKGRTSASDLEPADLRGIVTQVVGSGGGR
jgi:flagellar biosynthesis protein FlhF